MAIRMQQRRGTAAQWAAANPTLAAGEIGFETDSGMFKIGNGSSAWSDLSYFTDSQDFDTTNFVLNSAKGVSNGVATLNANGHVPISQLGALIANAPEALDTLQELADAVTAVDNAVDNHNALTQNVHGITDTAELETQTGAQAKADAAETAAVNAAVAAAAQDATDKADAAQAAAIAAAAADATSKAESAQTMAEATAQSALDSHNSATTNVHGILDTSVLATDTDVVNAVSNHNNLTLNVHGIADTSELETQTGAQAKADSAQSLAEATASADATAKADAAQAAAEATAASELSSHNSDTTNVHGIADTSVLATLTNVATAKQEAIDASATASELYTDTEIAALTKASVGLGNVDNTSDADKPVSTAQASAIATAKSEAIADATAQVNAVIASAPAALNTLDELAAALGDDANFATTVTNSLAAKAPLASPTFTGTVTVSASGITFSDGTQTKAGVPSITTFATALTSNTTLAAGEQDKFVPVNGAVQITLPATGYSTGQSIDFYQASGTGASFASTNSVVGTPGLKFRTTNSVVTAMKTSSGWLVFGDLSA